MRKANRKSICILIALLAVLCLVFAACGDKNDKETAAAEDTSVSEQTAEADATAEEAEKSTAEEAAKAEEEAKAKAEEEAAAAEAEKKAAEEKAAQEKAAKEKEEKAKEEKSKSSSKSKSSKKKSSTKTETKKTEKKKVWVEPVTETRTVTLDTGTRYCHGANSGGGCGASWHGSKDGTYNSWHKHWQDYVKKRTKEEAEKGNVYVCDHIHDDSRWVPDTTTEEVVVQEGYWKEVD